MDFCDLPRFLFTPSYLCHIKQQRDGVVEVGVGTTGVDPEVPENREQSRTGQ